jgi:hypothetical protein
MKAIPTAALFAALLVVAGCGSGSKHSASKVASGGSLIVVAGTKTFSKVKTGTVIACKGPGPMGGGGPTATVTTGQEEVAGSSQEIDESGQWSGDPSSKRNLRLTEQQDGRVTVSCTR